MTGELCSQQLGTRPGGRCDVQLSSIITDKYHKM